MLEQEGSGDFGSNFKQFVTGVEHFVETMHSGLSELIQESASSLEPTRHTSVKKFKGTKKILVVDEVEINRVLFGRYFQGLPFEITFAKSASEADQKLTTQTFDLVLRDWKELLGQGLTKKVLVEQVLAKIPN